MIHTLIVGAKHVGKSTLIQKVVRELNCTVSGFETKKEPDPASGASGIPLYIYPAGKPHQQEKDNLLGFCTLSHPKVIDGAFDRAAHLICEAETTGDLIVMDEIGFLETSSEAFCAEILKRLDGQKPVIAAVRQSDNPFLQAIRNHPNCRCFFITEENRDALFPIVLQFIRAQLGQQ